MVTLIDSEYIVETIKSFLLQNEGDEPTEDLILSLGAEILEISVDALLELIE